MENKRAWSKSGSVRISSILDSLRLSLKEEVDSDFLKDIERLSVAIKSDGILVNDSEELNKAAFGRSNIWRYLKNYIDDHFIQVVELYELTSGKVVSLATPSEQIKSKQSLEEWYTKTKEIVAFLMISDWSHSNQKLDAIISLVGCIYSILVLKEIRYCKFCFRRVISKNNCRDHSAGIPDFYLNVKKLHKLKDVKSWDWIVRQRGGRGVIGEYPYRHKYFKDVGMLAEIIDESKWEEAAIILTKILNRELIHLRNFLNDKAIKQNINIFPLHIYFPDYRSFVSWLYSESVLNNPYEDSISAFWLLNSLFGAETCQKAENEAKVRENKVLKRDIEIIRLILDGKSYNEVAKLLSVSKSLVGKIAKK